MKKARWLWGLLALPVLAGGILLFSGLRPVTAEAGGALPAAAEYCRYPFLAPFVTAEGAGADMSAPGEYAMNFRLFGIRRTATLTVVDTTPPTARAVAQVCFAGEEPDIGGFYADLCDATAVDVRYLTPPDCTREGEQAVSLVLTDAAGNSTTLGTTLTVRPITYRLTVEAGTPEAEVQARIRQTLGGRVGFGADRLDAAVPGERVLPLTLDGEPVRLMLTVEDTTPPVGRAQMVLLLLGQTAAPGEFVREVADAGAVEAAFAQPPDFTRVGAQPVTVVLTDAAGNTAEVASALRVYPAPAALTAELGTPAGTLAGQLLANSGLRFADGGEPDATAPGEQTLTLLTAGGQALTQTLTLVDTTPPAGRAQNRTAYPGDSLTAADFVAAVTDASPVDVRYTDTPPDFTRVGTQTVSVTLTDAAGNTSQLTASLTVVRDTEPPVIYGAADRTVYLGESISYLAGVTAWDAADGAVKVSVDASAVRLREPGRYSVTYTAADRAGNTATKTVTLTVSATDADAVAAMADEVLAAILSPDMTEYARARAIYDWVTTHLSYTAYPDKTDYIAAAFYGLRQRRGDCFVYYAVSRVLLGRAGIENLEIHRNIPDKPHFWNLVKYEGDWYHFDTCPHYPGHPLTAFLLTDREVKAYSENHVPDYYSFDATQYPPTP